MLEHGGCPAVGAVAIITTVVTLDMPAVLAGGNAAVMAGETVATGLTVIEAGTGPVASAMAVFTVVATGDVVYVLAGGDPAIVTGGTGTDHDIVVEARELFPAVGGVAGFAAARG